ncbi:hypothetical protein ASD11_14280 [Aeromicrobium sp. Root495]|uniref:DUF3618 domain-containing protein n=1 Tax=Aeromicrobium sp. Root495 TaxID=1736550 RepID=UPI0006FE152F|nr:DUF3618 domain-containing protein [Aeromicrobium sp. Root495]KQY55679.1 hypothetical protein ASD11_14280 [Aeromicrobium sp. Root495]
MSGPSISDIESDIEQMREQLTETIDALGAKLDVKSKATSHWQEIAVVATTAAAIVIAWKKL